MLPLSLTLVLQMLVIMVLCLVEAPAPRGLRVVQGSGERGVLVGFWPWRRCEVSVCFGWGPGLWRSRLYLIVDDCDAVERSSWFDLTIDF